MGKSLSAFWGSAWAVLEPPASTDHELPHQELTETGSTRQTSPVETPAPCMPGRRDCTSSWLKSYPKFSWFLSAKYYFQSCRAKEHFVESTETCFWNRRILQANVSTVQQHSATLCFASLGIPISGLSPAPERQWALPSATTGLSLLLNQLWVGLSSCSALQLLPASASSLWPFESYLGNPTFGKRLFKANSLHMINSSCRISKKPPSWLAKVTESQKLMAGTSNILQPCTKKWSKTKLACLEKIDVAEEKARSWVGTNWKTDRGAAVGESQELEKNGARPLAKATPDTEKQIYILTVSTARAPAGVTK